MYKLSREDIHIISRHSNWSEQGVDAALKENIYSDAAAWKKFLKLFFISLGVCFTSAGIVFFFAYNWADLSKFAKLGIMETLVLVATSLVLFSRFQETIKDTILTGAVVLVGVMFAVFGQIYQTGANAYDFFLGWTMFVSVWVLVSNFAPLWLLYLTLVNTTFILYTVQVAYNWSGTLVFTWLLVFNTICLIAAILISRFREDIKVPVWFSHILALACVVFASFGILTGIFDKADIWLGVLLFLTAAAYSTGIFYGLQNKSLFYLSIIPFSVIIIISGWLIENSENDIEFMSLLICFFIVSSVTFLIWNLIRIQKKWKNG